MNSEAILKAISPQDMARLFEEAAKINSPRNNQPILDEAELKHEMKQLMKMNVWLTKLFMNLLETVERPDGTKFLSSSPNISGGERKKAVLDLINYLLDSAGLPPCPGALGELVYNDLCVPYIYNC